MLWHREHRTLFSFYGWILLCVSVYIPPFADTWWICGKYFDSCEMVLDVCLKFNRCKNQEL